MTEKKTSIYIVGYMGSGKTTFGKRLAAKLNMAFVDLDNLIEVTEGKTINEIFELKGESYFREKEKEILQTTVFVNTVVATGGGTPCFFDNMSWMNTNGKTIYLKMTAQALESRLKFDKNNRPLLKNFEPTQLLNFIKKQLTYRETYYNLAHLKIKGISVLKAQNIENVCQKLMG